MRKPGRARSGEEGNSRSAEWKPSPADHRESGFCTAIKLLTELQRGRSLSLQLISYMLGVIAEVYDRVITGALPSGTARNKDTNDDSANQRWSMDFISDTLTDGRRFRTLCVIDDFSRECLTLTVVADHPRRAEIRL